MFTSGQKSVVSVKVFLSIDVEGGRFLERGGQDRGYPVLPVGRRWYSFEAQNSEAHVILI